MVNIEIESDHLIGVFGDSVGTFGCLPDNPQIAEITVDTGRWNSQTKPYLVKNRIPYKVNGQLFNN
jgi:hypothetical protein